MKNIAVTIIIIILSAALAYFYFDGQNKQDLYEQNIASLREERASLVSYIDSVEIVAQRLSDSLSWQDSVYAARFTEDSAKLAQELLKQKEDLLKKTDQERVAYFLTRTGGGSVIKLQDRQAYVVELENLDSANNIILQRDAFQKANILLTERITQLQQINAGQKELIALKQNIIDGKDKVIINQREEIQLNTEKIDQLEKQIKNQKLQKWVGFGSTAALIILSLLK